MSSWDHILTSRDKEVFALQGLARKPVSVSARRY